MNDLERIRERVIDVVRKAGRGHLGTSLSSLEAILAIRDTMRPGDIFLSSKGHDAAAQYVVLAEHGLLDESRLDTFRQSGGLPGHPTLDVPGIVANTGSLGMGLSKALGFALGHKRTVFVLLGDGEMMEGQNWEAALAISKQGVRNIIAVVDCNGFGQDGPAPLSNIKIERMFKAAGWYVLSVSDGNNYEKIHTALQYAAWLTSIGPVVIVMKTVKGNGVPEFAGQWFSHFGPPGVKFPPHPLYAAFGGAVEKVMEDDPKVILVGADTLRDLCCYELKDEFPERVFDFGIAEQNAVSFASARALMGQKPIVATYACFLRRAFEQIYNQVTEYTQVVYVGSMAGPLPDTGPGISHESLDDDRYMGNLMPVNELVSGEDPYSVLVEALSAGGPSYMRLLHG